MLEDDDFRQELREQIKDAFERGAADARHAELTLAKLAHDQSWDPADAAHYLAAAAARQVLLTSEHSDDRLEVAAETLLAFAVTLEAVDPHAIPCCLEELAEPGELDPDAEEIFERLKEAMDTADRQRRERAS